MDFRGEFLKGHPESDTSALDAYVEFIDRCVAPEPGDYRERHHVLPKSLFPEFRLASVCPANQVGLGAHDHFKAHYLLWRVLPADHRTFCAWKQMWCNKYKQIDDDLLEQYADQYAKAKEVHADYMRNRPCSDETRKRMSDSAKTKVFTEEHKSHMSAAKVGHKHSEETKQKIRETNLGQKRSTESRARMSEAQKRLPCSGERLAQLAKNTEVMTGVPLTVEHRESIRKANLGHTVSPETRKKISETRKRLATQVHPPLISAE